LKRIVCLGDSLTYGFPFGPRTSWTSRLAEMAGCEVINEGVNGNTTGDMLRRFELSVLARRPTHVVIMGGTNDVVWRESHDRIVDNLKRMVELAEANGIKPVLGLPIPIDDEEMERRLVRLREWIKAYAEAKNLPIIDFYSAFIDGNGNIIDSYFLDGAHPSRQGYEAMGRAIDPRVFDQGV